jgi:hypothetical protein
VDAAKVCICGLKFNAHIFAGGFCWLKNIQQCFPLFSRIAPFYSVLQRTYTLDAKSYAMAAAVSMTR